MRKRFVALLLAALALGVTGTPSFAFNQPPLNLGLTDILDGGPPGPGTYFTEYIQAYQSDEFKDNDGNSIPGDPKVATVLSMNQLVHVYNHKILGDTSVRTSSFRWWRSAARGLWDRLSRAPRPPVR